MKKVIFFSVFVISLILMNGCEKIEINEEIRSIDKDKVESPGGQSNPERSAVDKDKVESPGGQSGNSGNSGN